MIGWLVMAALADPVDLNAATVDELAALPGMGTIKARALAEWRAENGRCTEVDDLLAAPGIGPATVRGFNGAATCGDGTPPPLEAAVHPPPPVRRSDRVDLNRDGLEGLQRLPGVTEARARDIIDDMESASKTIGMRTRSSPAKLAEKRSMLRASSTKSSSAVIERSNSSSMPRGSISATSGNSAISRPTRKRSTRRSACTCFLMPGRWILKTT